MGIEKTFGIIKPDAVRNNNVGNILAMIEGAGLRIKALRYTHLTRPQAEGFYAVHKERPFFGELVEFMTSGPCVVYVLEGEEAITRYRGLMGATNPADADEGTIRKAYAASIGENAVHGSDATDTAAFEINWFFQGYEVA